MSLHEFLLSPSDTTHREGPHDKIVMSSRVRLARNIKGSAFPGWAKKAERIRILEAIRPAVESLPQMADRFSETMDNLTLLDKNILVERHLISREHAAKNAGSGLVFNREETLCMMINEEDHLRMQALRPGLQLKQAWQAIDQVDSKLEKKLEYAFSPELGYLTACPTNVGTGMRASAMMHLPGLVLSEQINQIIQAVNKVGLAVRGLYGEGTEALGNLFQISNQTTLGEKEDEILMRLNKVIEQILQHEQNSRASLLDKRPTLLLDNIGRAYGILRHAHSMASKEALNLLSCLKLGVDLGFFPEEGRLLVDQLFMETQPAHLQKSSQQKLQAEERDTLRAEIVRGKLGKFPKPDGKKAIERGREERKEKEDKNGGGTE